MNSALGTMGLLDQTPLPDRAAFKANPEVGKALDETVVAVAALTGAAIVAPFGLLLGWAAGHALAGLGIGAVVGGALGVVSGTSVSQELDAETAKW